MRNDILFGILITLLQEGKCTYNRLAEKFEVSKRTIQRYCLNLEMSGVPTMCTYGRTGGIQIMGSFDLKNMFFTKAETKRLLTHLKTSPLSSLDNIDRQIEDKLKMQTKETTDSTEILVDFKPWTDEYKLNPLIKLLNDELPLKKCYEIHYINSSGSASKRVISPYKFLLKESKWYLLAFCHLKKEIRLFKVNRIQSITPSNECYVELSLSEPEILNHINNSFDSITITLEVDESAISDTLEWLDEKKITYNKNGGATLTGSAINNNELISKIISNPSHIKLLEPSSLLNKIKLVTEKLQSLYA